VRQNERSQGEPSASRALLTKPDITDWWLTPIAWLFAHRPDWRDALGRLLLRVGNRFYYLLAVVFALIGAWDQFAQPFHKQLSNASFDWLMSHRPIAYRPDSDIIVLDIGEASLAALAPEYGRWPWPREILAQVASAAEAAGAQAIVFDILFSDPDVANPRSDGAFDRYVAASRGSFYSAVRLNPKNDAASQITLPMLNFAQPLPGAAARKPARANAPQTVALLPPYFKSIYDSTRVGITNIEPDQDNVVRWYVNFEDLGGYRIPSLPYRLAQVHGWPLPTQPHSLINWPRGAAPYRTIEFVAAYNASRQHDAAFFAPFAGKLVLLGSTAPSLNDVKATPVSRLTPGIYLLASAIDNTKHNSFLRTLHPAGFWLIEVLLLAAAVRLFARSDRATGVLKYAVIVPALLLIISLASISVSNLLMDLSVPTALVLAYLTFAKVFQANSHSFASGTGAFAPTAREWAAGRLQAACLPATVPRHNITPLLIRPGCPIKLWEPLGTGFGKQWTAQGWVLWRCLTPDAEDKSVPRVAGAPDGQPLELRWHDVAQVRAQDGSFPVAQSIVEAARDMATARGVEQSEGI
jgi:CHASE2 domain-containing sensor protein